MTRPRIGISSCLLGDEVRFDGGHKRDGSLVDALGPYVEWVRVCPEVELGLGVPREPVRLVSSGGAIRMIAAQTRRDHTDAMRDYAARRVRELAQANLAGYVLKAKSPSCGLRDVRVATDDLLGVASATGIGLFAAVLLASLPDLPVEDEVRLGDAAVRAAFVERAAAYGRGRSSMFALRAKVVPNRKSRAELPPAVCSRLHTSSRARQ